MGLDVLLVNGSPSIDVGSCASFALGSTSRSLPGSTAPQARRGTRSLCAGLDSRGFRRFATWPDRPRCGVDLVSITYSDWPNAAQRSETRCD